MGEVPMRDQDLQLMRCPVCYTAHLVPIDTAKSRTISCYHCKVHPPLEHVNPFAIRRS